MCVKEFLHINILDKPICTVGSFALCFSVSFPLAVCIFLCCNYNPLDGARQKRLQEPAPATNQSRGEGKQAPWPSDLFTKMTERFRHKSLASPAMTGKEDFNKKMLEEKKSDNNCICHFAILPSGHGKFINIGGSHFFLTSPRALLETTCNV